MHRSNQNILPSLPHNIITHKVGTDQKIITCIYRSVDVFSLSEGEFSHSETDVCHVLAPALHILHYCFLVIKLYIMLHLKSACSILTSKYCAVDSPTSWWCHPDKNRLQLHWVYYVSLFSFFMYKKMQYFNKWKGDKLFFLFYYVYESLWPQYVTFLWSYFRIQV